MFQTLRRPFALPSILVGCDIPQYIGWYTPRTNHQPLPVPPARGPGPWVPWVSQRAQQVALWPRFIMVN